MKWPFFKKKETVEEVSEENVDVSADVADAGVDVTENGEDAEVQSEQVSEQAQIFDEVETVDSQENVIEVATDEVALEENITDNDVIATEYNLSDTVEEVADDVVEEAVEKPQKKAGFFQRLKEGLTKTRNNIVSGLDAVFKGFSEIDDDFYEELEEILIMGDIGVHTTENILESLKQQVKKNHIKKPEECKDFLIQTIKEQMNVAETAYKFEEEQSIVFVIGVNGVGKTTSIGKLASLLKGQGRKVLLAAADTFRAAAGDQLAEWSHRAGVEMIGGVEGADPASVLYDAVNAAKSRKVDVLLCDTAGRLHNKKNLMEELKKMNRIIDREFPNAHRENLIVLDASTGQNALMQAKEFSEVADLTGIILTKMDGTAKGGIAVAIQSELGIPVKYIGVGERIEDLQKFDSDTFVDALFDVKLEEQE